MTVDIKSIQDRIKAIHAKHLEDVKNGNIPKPPTVRQQMKKSLHDWYKEYNKTPLDSETEKKLLNILSSKSMFKSVLYKGKNKYEVMCSLSRIKTRFDLRNNFKDPIMVGAALYDLGVLVDDKWNTFLTQPAGEHLFYNFAMIIRRHLAENK